MKKAAKRIIGLALAMVCLLVYIPQSHAVHSSALPSEFYLTQNVRGTCTLCSSAMMIRASMLLRGNQNWSTVTENSLRPDAWLNGTGLWWNFSHTVGNTTIQVGHGTFNGISAQDLKALLDKHPEGIVFYCGKIPHAVYLAGYEGDVFYCADTVEQYSGKMIRLDQSYLAAKYGNQATILKNATAYWYVADYIENGHSVTCHCSDTYAGTYVATAVSTELRIRAGHGTGYSILGTIPYGGEVTVLKASGKGSNDWAHVIYNGVVGYASMGYLKKIGQAGTVDADVLHIRSEASTNATILGYLERGTRVDILQTKQVGTTLWGRIDKGWISMDYVKMDEPVTPPQQPVTQMGTVTVDVLNIRANAGTGYAILGYLQRGNRVEILETKQVGTTLWGRTQKGWISMDYVKLDAAQPDPDPEQPEQTEQTGTVTVDILYIRANAGTGYAILGYLQRGNQVKILETKQVGTMLWGRVEQGWISLSYVALDAAQPEQMGTVTVDILYIRANAGTGYAILGYLQRGDQVKILETKQVGTMLWGRTDKGWISMDYVR